jgi:hypothetical protein
MARQHTRAVGDRLRLWLEALGEGRVCGGGGGGGGGLGRPAAALRVRLCCKPSCHSLQPQRRSGCTSTWQRLWARSLQVKGCIGRSGAAPSQRQHAKGLRSWPTNGCRGRMKGVQHPRLGWAPLPQSPLCQGMTVVAMCVCTPCRRRPLQLNSGRCAAAKRCWNPCLPRTGRRSSRCSRRSRRSCPGRPQRWKEGPVPPPQAWRKRHGEWRC